MKDINIYILAILLLLLSCKRERTQTTLPNSNEYACGFAISEQDGCKIVEMRNPWDTLSLLHRYILVPKEMETIPDFCDGTIIRIPVERVAVYGSIHCKMIDRIGELESVAGLCDVHYSADTQLKKRVADGEIVDLGSSFVPDVEAMISAAPEVIIVSSMKDRAYGKVSQLGIPIIEMSDYMESLPLARTEWIKFIGALYGKEEFAEEIYQATKQQYLELAKKGREARYKPTLFCELKTGNVWYQPGGNSYMARFYRDAGINYLWSENGDKGSIPLSYESVFVRAADADLWFLKYSADNEKTLVSLASEFASYKEFGAYKNKNVWAINAIKVPYYEEMTLSPHLVLRDIMLIAHPELFKEGETTKYFKKLKDE